MLKALAEYIVEQSKPYREKIGTGEYSDKGLSRIVQPTAKALCTSTLHSVVDYLKNDVDNVTSGKVIIHIEGARDVTLYHELNDDKNRESFISVSPALPNVRIGDYIGLEDFGIMLRSMFVQSDTTYALLKICGNITDENALKYQDDGVSQTVTARTGIARVEQVDVPNQVKLQPFRTFAEVKQPESEFVFRLKKSGENIYAGIFEADGGAWKLEAIKRIKGYLEKELSGMDNIVILA
ncbi:MAG: hypothetical protein HFI90_06920 [Clostridia bacterium]|nr:hypothetical protein [Clostridia bacterium]